MTERYLEPGELLPDELNANAGTERGEYLLDTSLEHYGAGRSILADGKNRLIAGNKTHAAAARKGFRFRVVDIAPDEILVARRPDLDLYSETDPTARDLATADNRVGAANLAWEFAALEAARDRYGSTALETFWLPEEVEDMAVEAALEELRREDEANAEQTPLDPTPAPPRSRSVVLVLCKDESEQARVIDLCDEHRLKWKIPG